VAQKVARDGDAPDTFDDFDGAGFDAFGGVRHTPPIPRTVSKAVRVLLGRLDAAERKHAADVSFYAMMICETLDVPPAQMRLIVTAAMLHDIGKVAIPEAQRIHPGDLTAYELANMRTHPEIGEAMASVHPVLLPYAPFIRHHHERYDGDGYPDGLRGPALPFGASVLAVAEAFATMITEQSYRPALAWHEAIAEVRRGSGSQFHPTAARGFLTHLGEIPAAALR